MAKFIKRFTLGLASDLADRLETAVFDLRHWRRMSLSSFVECAVEDLLARDPEERKAILDRYGASTMRSIGEDARRAS